MPSFEYEKEKIYLKLTNQPLDNYDNYTHEWKEEQYQFEYEFYIQVAGILIERYLNYDEHEYVNAEFFYEEQAVMLASHVYNMHSNIVASTQNSGIESISSNGRSVSFVSAEAIASQVSIPQYIKDMLPKPKSRVKVW